MTAVDIEKLNQLISRTDISGNDKVRWLTDFIDGREFQQQEQDNNKYSEEEFLGKIKLFARMLKLNYNVAINFEKIAEEWFEQIKNK
jgi:hypothetical protein